ncbi:MAG: DUF4145 domain-containing protein [Chloroflexi bacterium]|nr:DUF4145 domain-containing protein [Chloroflexota bacterium]
MPLPPHIDQTIRQTFPALLKEGTELLDLMKNNNTRVIRGTFGDERTEKTDVPDLSEMHFSTLKTKYLLLLQQLSPDRNISIRDTIADVRSLENRISHLEKLLGLIKGIHFGYKRGLIESLIADEIEERNATSYLDQATQLLREDTSAKYDYISAAILTGAVLENTLRKLCQQQTPPVATTRENGYFKTLNPLITDLLNAKVISEARADQLKSWAKLRNFAAHGEFEQITRPEVESMLGGVKEFLADTL